MIVPRRMTRWLYLTITLSVLSYIILVRICFELSDQKWEENPLLLHWPSMTNNIKCHSFVKGDALKSVEDPSFSPKPNSIFFHETSCRGGIDSRQGCAVESAARAHPHWDVYLLFNSPISKYILKRSCLVKLLQYPNVKLARVLPYSYSKDTIVHSIVTKQLHRSKHPVEHSSKIMSILTLNKWGGVYLDLDVIVLNRFDSLPNNWIAKETTSEISSGAMAFLDDGVGKEVTSAILKEMYETYTPDGWSINGSNAIQRVLSRRCKDIFQENGDCNGLLTIGHERFNSIYNASSVKLFFDKGQLFSQSLEDIYLIHLWSFFTKMHKVHKDSPYATLAKIYCPRIYNMYGDEFGV